jgi:hypothetical protein
VIHLYNDEHLRRWNRGEHRVQLDLPGRNKPMGYCDGTPEDEEELLRMAREEGEHEVEIKKRLLKTGREIWTLCTVANQSSDDVADD